PEILARTRYGFGAEDQGAVLDQFYLDWERWAADVAESHTNYPVLLRFRSPVSFSSWLVALVAVLDSAALWLALAPGRAPAVGCPTRRSPTRSPTGWTPSARPGPAPAAPATRWPRRSARPTGGPPRTPRPRGRRWRSEWTCS